MTLCVTVNPIPVQWSVLAWRVANHAQQHAPVKPWWMEGTNHVQIPLLSLHFTVIIQTQMQTRYQHNM